jgi:hypothetical protein
MVYTVVPTVYTTDTWTASNHNLYIKDNFAAVEAQGEGEDTIWIPAYSMAEQAGASPGAIETVDFGTLCHYAIPFDPSTDEFLNFLIGMPKRYDSASVHVKYLWTTKSGGSAGNVIWSCAINGIDNDDALGADPSAGVSNVTDAWIADLDAHKTAWDEVTVQGSPSDENDVLEMQVGRDADNGSDTLTVDAYLLGMWLRWTADVEMDD